jgi:acyl-coenzyme A synthetase/AMP-(fatty) acid ligase
MQSWAAVTMLAIVMAGGVFVPIDPATLVNRLRDLIADVDASLMIASPVYREKLEELGVNGLFIEEHSMSELAA